MDVRVELFIASTDHISIIRLLSDQLTVLV